MIGIGYTGHVCRHKVGFSLQLTLVETRQLSTRQVIFIWAARADTKLRNVNYDPEGFGLAIELLMITYMIFWVQMNNDSKRLI